jgi:hypothetical protein
MSSDYLQNKFIQVLLRPKVLKEVTMKTIDYC